MMTMQRDEGHAERCPGSRRRTEVEAAVTWASGETSSPASMPRSSGSSPPPYTLALGTLPDTTHTRYCTHSDVTHDKPVAKRRRWLTQGHVGSKLRSHKTARPHSCRSLPASGWNET